MIADIIVAEDVCWHEAVLGLVEKGWERGCGKERKKDYWPTK